MSGNFVLLEEAAKLLGIAPDALVEMRSRGEIRGFREGSSWKFKMEDIQQAIRNRQDAGDSDIGSDVSLIADPGSGSDVKLVAGRSGTNLGDSQIGSDISLDSSIKIDLDGSDLPLDAAGGSGLELSLSEGSDVLEASGLKLSPASGTDKIILPIWHKVSKDEVAGFSPTLADKVALNTGVQSLDEIVEAIVAVVSPMTTPR